MVNDDHCLEEWKAKCGLLSHCCDDGKRHFTFDHCPKFNMMVRFFIYSFIRYTWLIIQPSIGIRCRTIETNYTHTHTHSKKTSTRKTKDKRQRTKGHTRTTTKKTLNDEKQQIRRLSMIWTTRNFFFFFLQWDNNIWQPFGMNASRELTMMVMRNEPPNTHTHRSSRCFLFFFRSVGCMCVCVCAEPVLGSFFLIYTQFLFAFYCLPGCPQCPFHSNNRAIQDLMKQGVPYPCSW